MKRAPLVPLPILACRAIPKNCNEYAKSLAEKQIFILVIFDYATRYAQIAEEVIMLLPKQPRLRTLGSISLH